MPRRPPFSQQASVRRGPRASATSLFTASLCSPRSPCLGDLSFHSKPLFAEVPVPRRPPFSQQASVRRGPRALATSLFTASLCSPRSPCLGDLSFHGSACRIRSVRFLTKSRLRKSYKRKKVRFGTAPMTYEWV